MPALTKCRTLLIVDSPGAHPLADRLKDRLLQMDHEVHIKDAASVDDTTLTTIDLIVVCAAHVPGNLRLTPLPLIVCHPEALPELGMTAADPVDDYGFASYEEVTVGEELNGGGLAGGFIGRQVVSKGDRTQGWGKPGTAAIVVATVSQSAQRAALFAYQQSEPMVTLVAPHRRVAFLIADAQAQFLLARSPPLRSGSRVRSPGRQCATHSDRPSALVYQQGRADDHDVNSRLSVVGATEFSNKDRCLVRTHRPCSDWRDLCRVPGLFAEPTFKRVD